MTGFNFRGLRRTFKLYSNEAKAISNLSRMFVMSAYLKVKPLNMKLE